MLRLKFATLNEGRLQVDETAVIKTKYGNYILKKDDITDGVSVPKGLTGFFTAKELMAGLRAACVHDQYCKKKKEGKRREASEILVELWKEDGLPKWKAWFVFWGVEIVQRCKGWK